jgi:hypothetical protein
MTLSLVKSLRRFLLHVLPKGFVAHSQLQLPRQPPTRHAPAALLSLLGSAPQSEQPLVTASDANDLRPGPECGGPMWVIARFTAVRDPASFSSWPADGRRMKTTIYNTESLRASAQNEFRRSRTAPGVNVGWFARSRLSPMSAQAGRANIPLFVSSRHPGHSNSCVAPAWPHLPLLV